MTAYDVHISRYYTRQVLDMPGLAHIDLRHPNIAVLRFETAPGCEPCGLEFVMDEVERMGAMAMRGVLLPDGSTRLGRDWVADSSPNRLNAAGDP